MLQTSTLAVVRCTVAMTKAGVPGRFNNVRLFVRADEQDGWRLLAWVNENADCRRP